MNHPYTNKLIHESSPYLLQHAHNPVDWYPWGPEALEKAKLENKLLLISIGYSSCHWCHVMEKESFEDTTVANFMNAHFINIKVDREERPDIDDVYMTACQLSSGGNCGWPLNSFALPDGRPVWAGTYFPKTKWLEVLDYFRKTWVDETSKMEDYADRLVSGVRDNGLDSLLNSGEEDYTIEDAIGQAKLFMDRTDPHMGGRRGAPKFPMPNNWQYLMHHAFRYDDAKAKQLVLVTLDRMMMGGIYDQIEGGFARYSTDTNWLVPHFEKMLYDNGQLISLYAQAYAWTGKQDYLEVVRQTIAFSEKYWLDPSGGFYSSFDADSEGEEGKYYVWTKAELDSLLPAGPDRDLFYMLNDIREAGNWEHGQNILQLHRHKSEVARQFNISEEALNQKLKKTYAELQTARARRTMPGLDDKVLTSWNGLMLQGLIDAYRYSGDQSFLTLALRNADFLLREMKKDGYRLDRNFKNGKSSINAFLDDYATVIQALISLYQVTFDEKWLKEAAGFSDHVLLHFDGDESGMLYFTSDLDPPLVARRIDIGDNVIPSANSMMARNFLLLGELIYREDYVAKAKAMFLKVWPRIKKDGQPSFYSNWCQMLLQLVKPPYEIAIVGHGYEAMQKDFLKTYQPDVVILGGSQEGSLPLLQHKYVENETFIYVCQNKTCKRPVTSFAEAKAMLTE